MNALRARPSKDAAPAQRRTSFEARASARAPQDDDQGRSIWPSRAGRAVVRGARLRSRQRQVLLAELVDRGDELVAGLEPDLLVLRIARDHAFRCAREDQVAGLERHVV